MGTLSEYVAIEITPGVIEATNVFFDRVSDLLLLPAHYRWSEVTRPTHLPQLNDVLIWSMIFMPFWVAAAYVCAWFAPYMPVAAFKSDAKDRIGDVLLSISKKTILLFGTWAVLHSTHWFMDTVAMWTGFPEDHQNPTDLRVIYFLEMSWYFYQTLHQFATPHLRKRSDVWIMAAHHIVTAILMGMSYCENFLRVGVLIMFLHEISDWFFALSKLGVYIGSDLLLNAAGIGTIISWIATRLYYFPFEVIYVVPKVALPLVDVKYHHFIKVSCVMLWSLCVMHVYWFYLISWTVVGVFFRDGKLHDPRETTDRKPKAH